MAALKALELMAIDNLSEPVGISYEDFEILDELNIEVSFF